MQSFLSCSILLMKSTWFARASRKLQSGCFCSARVSASRRYLRRLNHSRRRRQRRVKAWDLSGRWVKPDDTSSIPRSIRPTRKSGRLLVHRSCTHRDGSPLIVASCNGELAPRETALRYRAKLADHRPSLRVCFASDHPLVQGVPKRDTPTGLLEKIGQDGILFEEFSSNSSPAIEIPRSAARLINDTRMFYEKRDNTLRAMIKIRRVRRGWKSENHEDLFDRVICDSLGKRCSRLHWNHRYMWTR